METEFPKSVKRSRGRRVHISNEKSGEIKKYSEESAKNGIPPGSEQFMEGLTKIINSHIKPETRVACEFGVKGVQGHVFKPKGREKEPWWMHILNTKYPADTLRGFNMYELELLIKDLCANTGFVCTAIPKNKDGRVAALKDLIGLAMAKNRDVARCPHYDHMKFTWIPEEWCINCGRDCLKDNTPKPAVVVEKQEFKQDRPLFDNDPDAWYDRDIPDNAYDARKEGP
ncbi:MAG: hypothetical protein PHH85_02395 [Candidatus Methanoperedens sp.]|nr:hypothetical protein [Candidatus Methanoperedens sp.]